MGIIAYDDASAFLDSSSFTNVTNGDNLLTPNIRPGAILDDNDVAEIDLIYTKQVRVRSIGIMGIRRTEDVPTVVTRRFEPWRRNFELFRTSNGGSSWTAIDGADFIAYRVFDSTQGVENIVCVMKDGEDFSADGVRVRFANENVDTDETIELGSIFVAQGLIEDQAVAAKASRIGFEDTSISERSRSGAVYSTPAAVTRAVYIQHGSLQKHMVLGGLPGAKRVEIGTPTLSFVTDLGGGRYQTTTNVSQMTYASSSLDNQRFYEARFNSWADSATVNNSPLISTDPNGYFGQMGQGKASMFIRGNPSGGTFKLIFNPQGTLTIEDIELYEFSQVPRPEQWVEGGLSNMAGSTGTGRPCIVLMNEDQPGTRVQCLYGYPTQYDEFTHIGGDLFTGGFQMIELS